MITGQKHNQTIPTDPTLAVLLQHLTEAICELEDDRAVITSVVRMTNGRIGFSVRAGEGCRTEHFTLQLRKGQE